MIKVLGDYHTHTTYSSGFKKVGTHASGSIRDNAEAALKKGLSTLVISDHGPGHYIYGVRKKNIPVMREEIDRLNLEFEPKGLKILLGVEANLTGMDGKLDIEDELLRDIDFLTMGYHYGVTPDTIKDGIYLYIFNPLAKLFRIGSSKMTDLNTKAYIKALENYPIDMISHPGSKAPVNIVELARAASKTKTALEISSKHDELSVESISLLLEEDVIYLANSDAHSPEHIGEIQEAIDKAKEAKLPLNRIKNIELIEEC